MTIPEAAIELVDGWGPFRTLLQYRDRHGRLVRWESRRSRKRRRGPPPPHVWWEPRAAGWWMGVLFAVGSLCFALGSVPAYAKAVGPQADSATYFVGSLFFTTAAFLQYREAVEALHPLEPPGATRWTLLRVRWRRIDWLATAIQLIGTFEFNISTAHALQSDLTTSQANQMVWRPDVIGSICFLVSSGLAWFEVCHRWIAWRPRDIGWWITLANLVGSIAFGVSAIASYTVPSSQQLVSIRLTNGGTLVGALCFLAGAVLLLAERNTGPQPAAVPVGATASP